MHGTANDAREQRPRWREYVERVKAEALRRPLEVLERVAGIPPERLDGRGHPCPNPRCPDGPGRDRFSVINVQTGAVHCRRCCTSSVPGGGTADCIDAVKWMRGVSFPEAIRLIGDHFGIDPPDASPPASVARPSGGPAAPAAANAGGARAPRDASGKPSGQRTARGGGHTSGKPFPTAEAAIAELDRRMAREDCRRVAQWPYLDAAGEHVASVVRYDRPTPPDSAKPDKTFRPVSRHPDGWRIGDPPGPWPLYTPPLPDGSRQPAAEHLAARPDDPVFVVEGEKCADAAARCGLLAVAAAHGANAAGKTDWSPLAGRDVVILADHDDAGKTGAEAYAKAAHAAGAASVRIVDAVRLQAFWMHDPQRASANDPELLQQAAAELPAGYDIADMEAECADDEERHGLREAITEASLHTDPWTPPPPTPPAVDELLWRPFPVHCLPAPVADFVAAGAEALFVDPAYLALPVLVACAACVGRARTVRLKESWHEPSILWGVVIGDSGTGKTPAYHCALRHLYDADRQDRHTFEAATKAYQRQRLAYEAELADWKRARRKDAQTPPDPPEPPQPPVCRRLIVADTTCEALRPILAHNPRGLLLARDELDGWFGSHNEYKRGKGSDVPNWLSTWNAGPWIIDRIEYHASIPAAVVSIVGGMQPEVYRRALGAEHVTDGLAARMLAVWPPERPRRWSDAEIPPAVAEALAHTYDRLRDLSPIDDEHGPQPVVATLSDAAVARWRDWHDRHAERLESCAGPVRAALAKLLSYCARFALLFALIRDPETRTVEDRDVRDAITLADWFAHETQRVYRLLLGDETSAEARELADLTELVRRHGGAITVRELMHASRRYRDSAELAEAALDKLVAAGLAERQTRQTGGRPATVYALRNDRLGPPRPGDPEAPQHR